MSFYIRLESERDLIWLQNLLDRYVRKLKENTALVSDSSETVLRIYDAAISAQPTEQAAPMGVPQEVLDKDPKPEPKKKKTPKDEFIPNLCPSHKKYSGQRVPRGDCDTCWKTYKKFHPENYEKARRDFDRKMVAS